MSKRGEGAPQPRGRARRGDSTGMAPSGGARAARPSTYGKGGRDPTQRRGGAEVGEGVSEVGGARCESGGACVSAHVDARVAVVRACATHTEGGELSARRARPAQRLWIDVQRA